MARRHIRIALISLLSVSAVLAALSLVRAQQKFDDMQIDRGRGILRDARDSVKKNYYDPTYHGLDLEGLYQQYDERIKNASSFNECLRMCFLLSFSNSRRTSWRRALRGIKLLVVKLRAAMHTRFGDLRQPLRTMA